VSIEPRPQDIEISDEDQVSGLVPLAPSGWNDPLTGMDGPRLWDRIISSETARVLRYRRPATVVLVEMAGLAEFARAWGAEVAERLFVRVARTLAVEVRASDHIARIDRTRFAILLTETDEIAAINFVERTRAACEAQMPATDQVRIGIGWAMPADSTDLRGAIGTAAIRLAKDLQRAN
jgi:diguanylate cyclase (GGDEF)-like protein